MNGKVKAWETGEEGVSGRASGLCERGSSVRLASDEDGAACPSFCSAGDEGSAHLAGRLGVSGLFFLLGFGFWSFFYVVQAGSYSPFRLSMLGMLYVQVFPALFFVLGAFYFPFYGRIRAQLRVMSLLLAGLSPFATWSYGAVSPPVWIRVEGLLWCLVQLECFRLVLYVIGLSWRDTGYRFHRYLNDGMYFLYLVALTAPWCVSVLFFAMDVESSERVASLRSLFDTLSGIGYGYSSWLLGYGVYACIRVMVLSRRLRPCIGCGAGMNRAEQEGKTGYVDGIDSGSGCVQ